MIEPYFRTGPAGKLLNISSYHMRRLCEIGLINAVLTAGGQWQIPASTIRQLQEQGVPPIPQGLLGGQAEDPPRRPRMDEPEDQASAERPQADSAEVMESADRVKIAKDQLQRREVELDIEEVEDEFGRRARAKAEREEVRMEMEQRTRQREEASQGRLKLESAWLKYAWSRLPEDTPPDVKLAIPGLLSETLGELDLAQELDHILPLVDAVVDKALSPWRRQRRVDEVIEAAVDQCLASIKPGLPTAQLRKAAIAVAHHSVRLLGDKATMEEVEAAAQHASMPLVRGFEHFRACQKFTSRLQVRGASPDEMDEAREVVGRVCEGLPAGASERQMAAAADEALEPLRQRILVREEVAMREDVIRCTPLP